MTTKRFTINEKEIIQDKQVWCMAHSEHCADVIATAMNELHEENKYLKSLKWNQDCINEISMSMQQIQLLEKENEQLKQRINELEKEIKELSYGEADWIMEEYP